MRQTGGECVSHFYTLYDNFALFYLCPINRFWGGCRTQQSSCSKKIGGLIPGQNWLPADCPRTRHRHLVEALSSMFLRGFIKWLKNCLCVYSVWKLSCRFVTSLTLSFIWFWRRVLFCLLLLLSEHQSIVMKFEKGSFKEACNEKMWWNYQ